MDSVLTGATPRLTTADAVEIGATLFGVHARAARDLGSERDRTFLLEGDGPVAILKVSNAAEDPDVLDMEAAVALHVTAVDPDLRVALPWRPASTGDPGPARAGDEPARLRARVARRTGRGSTTSCPGSSRIAAAELSDAALVAWGETTARLGQALRGFMHPSAQRVMLWDVQHALRARAMLDDIRDPHARAAVERVLDEFERRVTPVWPRLRAQVAHTDLSVDNTLTDDVGVHHRHHRLRRHEPHGAHHRARVGAGLRVRRPRRRRADARGPAGRRRLPTPRAARRHRTRRPGRRLGGALCA